VTFGHDGSFDRDTVERLVRACRSDWTVSSYRHAEDGTDAVYFVTVETPDGTREVVLKSCAFLDPEAFRPEPVLLRLFQPTPVPVPRVLGVVPESRPDLPTPCFLMERREGHVPTVADLPANQLNRLARGAGRHLAHVHTTGEFDRFGPVRCRQDVARDHSAVAVEGIHLTVGEEGDERWPERLRAQVEDRIGDIADRFADVIDPLERFIRGRLADLDGLFTPALTHHDYRPGNLLIDPPTGETEAVLDWGNPFTAERAYNLVSVESYLCDRVPPGHPRRNNVRAAMRVGYAEVTGLPALPERRRELYLAVTHLAPLVWFEQWHADATAAEREARAEDHREYVRSLLYEDC
jgi:aminoglycoside phosphotransferase (APT) family kinase protein